MVVYSETMVKYKKNTINKIVFFFFWISISIQRVQGATWEGQEPISEVENRSSSAADMWSTWAAKCGSTREGQEPISEVENRCSSAADMWRDVLSPKGWTCGGHHVGAKKK